MISPVLLIWTLLSILVSALATYAFVQPAWFRTADGTRTFGMVSLCVTKTQVTIWQKCEFYGGYFNLGHLPSGYWQAACVLYGIGCVLLCCGAFLAVCTSCMTAEVVRSVTVMAGYVQFIAVLFMISGLFVYPFGLGSNLIGVHCGPEVKPFHAGNCYIGWSFILSIASTALSIFCPILSQFTDMKTSDLI